MAEMMNSNSDNESLGNESNVSRRDPQQSRESGRQRQAGTILDSTGCLQGLSQLPGLIAMGVLKPGQANAMRATFGDILKAHYANQSQRNSQGISNDDLQELLRTNPQMLNLLEPLLNDQQFSAAMEFVQKEKSKNA